MFKKIYGKFNAVTDFATRLDFWCGAISLITPIGGSILKLADYIDYIVLLLSFLPLAIWLYIRSKAKNTNQLNNPQIEIPPTEEKKELPQEAPEHENTSPEYLSLQEATNILADETQFTREKLQWVAKFPGGALSMKDVFWKRDNPSKVHKETLDEGTTIPLIHLCLHMLRKNNSTIYGTRPSFSNRDRIPFEEIKYFDADYKKLYSHIERDSGSLIYNEVEIVKDDLTHAIKNTDFAALIKEMNED